MVHNRFYTPPGNTMLCESLKTVVNTGSTFVPIKMTWVRFYKPWIIRECRRLIRIKKRRYKRFKQTKRLSDWNNYQQTTRASSKACAYAYNEFIHHLTEDNNKKKLFSIAKRRGLKSLGYHPNYFKFYFSITFY